MKLSLVIAALRARCPIFENRVGGAAEFKALSENAKMKLPAAYVVPADDTVGEQKSQTDYWQELTEGFAVIVVLDNRRDLRGQAAAFDAVDDRRAEIWKALLGWQPDDDADPINYAGGQLLDMDRGLLLYQYDFTRQRDITEQETRQQDDLDALGDLKTLSIDVDYINHGSGPDGTIEHHTEIHFTE